MERKKLIKLVTAAQSGDSKALDTLFNAFYNDVYYFALKTVKDEDTACEVTQDTFVSILKNFKDLKEPAAFVTWMKQIAYNHCARFFQKKKDVLVEEDEEGNTVFDALTEERTEFVPDEALDQEDFRKTIMGMLDELSPEQRSATMLYYYSEMSVKQIAQIQGVSEGTVKSRLNYARKAIKKSVEDYEKKNDVKLHSVALLPLLFWLFAGSKEDMTAGAVPIVVDGVAAETGIVLTVESSSAFGGAALLAKLMGLPVIIKVTAVVAVAVVVLVIACISAAIQQEVPSVEPTVSLQTEQTNITEPTNTKPVVTEPMVVSPSVSEPPVTEPPVTEPPVIEPTTTEPPVTEPVVTEPPVTEPTTTEPPTEEPPVEEPEIEEPEVTVYYVPEGCTYIMADGTELQPGEAMPETCSDGDEFATEAYTYKYGYEYDGSSFGDTDIEGWSVAANDKELEIYPELMCTINGAPLISMRCTFKDCEMMCSAPAIPHSVTNLSYSFANTSLQTSPVLPDGVTDISHAFALCSRMTEAPVIPASVVNMVGAFYWSGLKATPEIPYGVVNMDRAFYLCESLTTASDIPDSVTSIIGTFGQTALITAPSLGNGVTNMADAFEMCGALKDAPVIPTSVTNMEGAFSLCTALTGKIVVNSKHLSSYDSCFSGTVNEIILTGSCDKLNELAATSENGNVTIA